MESKNVIMESKKGNFGIEPKMRCPNCGNQANWRILIATNVNICCIKKIVKENPLIVSAMRLMNRCGHQKSTVINWALQSLPMMMTRS